MQYCSFADWFLACDADENNLVIFVCRFWEVDNFSDDTECLLVVVCWKIRLSKKCTPCHRLSVGFSNQLFDIVQREGNDS